MNAPPSPQAAAAAFPPTWLDPAALPARVAAAQAAQRAWGAQPVAARGRALRRLSAVMAECAEALAERVSGETGKPVVEAMTMEVLPAVHLAAYFGRHGPRLLAPRPIAASLLPHRRSHIVYSPRGVVACITPWNFPLAIPFGEVAMALCAGNAVVLKPSEHTPNSACALPDLLAAADIDPALLQVVVGDGPLGAALLDADVQMVLFTGSTAVGRRVAARCGERLLPCVVELGGKDAAVVLEDADLEHTAKTLLWGALANAGQACASIERVYAVGAIHAPLVRRLQELVAGLRQGDGRTQDVDVGEMITAAQHAQVACQLAAARAAGATLFDGNRPPRAGYIAPTVVTGVDDTMPIFADETFGPVLPVQQVASVAEAVARANASPYGLTAAVFGGSRRATVAVAGLLQAGTVMVGDALMAHALPEAPWGGLKASGLGATHGADALRHMCVSRHLNLPRGPQVAGPWLFPYRRALVRPLAQLLAAIYGAAPWWRRVALLCRGAASALRAWRRPIIRPGS